MRIACFVCLLALVAGASLYGLEGAAAQGSPEAQQACTPDAMRLCSQFIPDVPKVTACMKAKYAQLSEPCRIAMRGGSGHRATREAKRESKSTRHERHEARRESHHYRAHGHCDPFTHLCN